MKWFWEILGKIFVKYGKFGGGIPSVHGSFEPTIPDVLTQAEQCDSQRR